MKVEFTKERLEEIVNVLQRINREELKSTKVTETRQDFWRIQGYLEYYLFKCKIAEA